MPISIRIHADPRSKTLKKRCALSMLSSVYTHLRFSYKVCSFYVVWSLHPPPLFILGVLFLCCPEFTPTSAFHIRCALSMLSGVYTHLRFSYTVCCFYVVRSLHTPPLFILGVLFHGVRSLLPPPLFIKGVCRLVLKLPPRSGSVFEMRIRIQVLKLKKKGANNSCKIYKVCYPGSGSAF